MKLCSRCVLPETFPGIRFDEHGVCNHCRMAPSDERNAKSRKDAEDRFAALMREHQGRGCYDVVVGYSGGKDSTYSLIVFKELGLRALAVTYDNGFLPGGTLTNIRNVVERLGIDHMLVKPRFDVLARVFKRAAQSPLFGAKAAERAADMCTACIGFVKFGILRQAIEMEIPFIGYGWSPGQIPLSASIVKNNPEIVRVTQQQLLEPLREVAAAEDLRPYFLEERHFQRPEAFPYNVSPVAFAPAYSEEMVVERVGHYGWTRPEGVDSNSTNCLLNSYAIRVHKARWHFHPYHFEVAKLVREGSMTRDEGIAKMNEPEPEATVRAVEARLSAATTP
ncbi:MAG TPA: hypothetical protein VGQ83_20410 [Polyangia bacterium]|jgi:hypothetical protein